MQPPNPLTPHAPYSLDPEQFIDRLASGIFRASHDPGSITRRENHEEIHQWSRRAINIAKATFVEEIRKLIKERDDFMQTCRTIGVVYCDLSIDEAVRHGGLNVWNAMENIDRQRSLDNRKRLASAPSFMSKLIKTTVLSVLAATGNAYIGFLSSGSTEVALISFGVGGALTALSVWYSGRTPKLSNR